MIHWAGFSPEDEGSLEVPEIELEFVEIPTKNAFVLIPGDKKDKAQNIVSDIIALKDVLGIFSTKKYPEYTVYTIYGDTEKKEVYIFPVNTSYENRKDIMQGVLRAKNLMGDCSGQVIVGIQF